MNNDAIEKLRDAVRAYAVVFDHVQAVLPKAVSEEQLCALNAEFDRLRKLAQRL